MMVKPDPVRRGQESVWSYPRPAVAEPCARHIRIMLRGAVVADTRRSVRTLETSHPPTYYLPPADIDMSLLRENARSSVCEWKGAATYFDLVLDGLVLRNIAWSYPEPTAGFQMLRDHLAFYAAPFDACLVDGERATPQEGPFYGGWVTADLAGPFKGGAGTNFW